MTNRVEYIGVVVGTADFINGIYTSAQEGNGIASTMGVITGAYGAVATPLSITPGGAMVMGPPGVMLGVVKVSMDAAYTNSVSPGDVLTIAGAGIGSFAGMALVAGASLPILPALLVTATALSIAGGMLNLSEYRIPIFATAHNLLSSMEAEGWGCIDPYGLNQAIYNGYCTAASTRPAPQRIDPLALDLDGDGIETIGINPNGPVLTFDHNADGVRTGTGWVRADDAWLVLDRNGNGAIDSGRELFGIDTLKASGQYATSGLDALRELDSNADGVFNASDAAFAQVQLWRDLDQDGTSQADELFSLADQGIASINLSGTTANTNLANLGNGNTVGATAVVTRSHGSTTQAFDLNAAHNPFFRSSTSEVPFSEEALALPDMGGAGWVRDLREAISLSQQQAEQMALLNGNSPGRWQVANDAYSLRVA